jgi:hypothetical protein
MSRKQDQLRSDQMIREAKYYADRIREAQNKVQKKEKDNVAIQQQRTDAEEPGDASGGEHN